MEAAAAIGHERPWLSLAAVLRGQDAAWLPPWLQTSSGDCQNNGGSDSFLRCGSVACFEESTSNGKNAQSFRENMNYNGCHLYLSGDDGTPAGCTSQTALHFGLHLSSDGVSDTTSRPLNEVPQTGKDEKKISIMREPIPENPVIQGETNVQQGVEAGEIAQDMSAVGCICSMPQEVTVKPLSKSDQKNLQSEHGNLDDHNLREADVNDAIELCISASEAMTISDIISNSQLENLTAATILEISLHVKETRNACCLGVEAGSASTDDVDELDQLFDLDECTMEDAYNDVGLAVTKIVESRNNLFCGIDYSQSTTDSVIKQQIFLQSTSLCDLNTCISESPCQNNGEAKKGEAKALEPYNNGMTFQKYDASATESKKLNSEPPTAQQTRPICVSMFSILPDQHDQSIQVQIADTREAIAETKMGSKEHGGILQDGNFSKKGNAFIRKSMKGLFNGETSYISESDFMDDNQLEQTEESKPEIISSSNTPINLSLCVHKGKEGAREGIVLSEDVMQFPKASFVDSLCSIVPCSICSDDDALRFDDYNQSTGGHCQSSNGRFIGEKSSNGRVTLSHWQEVLSLDHLAQDGDYDLSKFSSSIPIFKKFKSLKPYSMVMPGLNSAKNTILPNEQVPSLNITKNIIELFPVERNENAFVCTEDESVILKCMNRHGEVVAPLADGSNHNHNLLSKDQENIRLSPVLETEYDDLVVLNDEHEKRSINIKKRHHQTYEVAKSNDDGSVKRYSTLGMPKHKSKISSDDARNGNQGNSVSLESASHLNSSNKKVHFLDANWLNQDQDSHHRTNRRPKEFSSLYKSQTRNRTPKSGPRFKVDEKPMIFYGLEFLLTGFSSQKEKELEALINQYGGYVLPNIPARSPSLTGRWRLDPAIKKPPIILSPEMVKTTKFLYGCAINTWTLKANWLFDGVQSGSILPPWKYMTRPIQLTPRQLLTTEDLLCIENQFLIFKQLGVMLYGKVSFYNKFSKIIKHGGGRVFKSLHRLIQSLKVKENTFGVVLVENEASVSRHLKHCVSEYNLETAPISWITNSLFSGKLLPLKKDRHVPFHRFKVPLIPMGMSQEI